MYAVQPVEVRMQHISGDFIPLAGWYPFYLEDWCVTGGIEGSTLQKKDKYNYILHS